MSDVASVAVLPDYLMCKICDVVTVLHDQHPLMALLDIDFLRDGERLQRAPIRGEAHPDWYQRPAPNRSIRHMPSA